MPGHEVHLLDKTFDREKPCGGGVPWRGLSALADLSTILVSGETIDRGSQAAGKAVQRIVFESPTGRVAEVALPRPVAVFSRRVLDRALVQDAKRAGAILTMGQVCGIARAGERWEVALVGGALDPFDHLVGADGARSAVRRAVASSFAPEDLSQAVGWYLPARTSSAMTIRFDPRIAGYLWVFPRPDHLAVGACAPLTTGATGALWDSARALLETLGVSEDGLPRYSALIPSLGPAALASNRVAGPGWSLVGDAAGTVDPLTREGIGHAIRSAELLAGAFASGAAEAYGALWREAFLPEFAWAAQRRDRFFASDLTDRLVQYLSRSAAIRRVMADLILGDQDYRTLKRRLLRTAVPATLQLASSKALARFSAARA